MKKKERKNIELERKKKEQEVQEVQEEECNVNGGNGGNLTLGKEVGGLKDFVIFDYFFFSNTKREQVYNEYLEVCSLLFFLFFLFFSFSPS